ncbi:MAG: hypothetical protein QOJ02_950 [Acidobacteriota bacterium]|jgi:hypothetical protein|nr:hypothetical protein [Acidobacteriota bacterium]
MRKLSKLTLAALFVFILSALAFAQSTTTGAVGITTTDPQGAVIANATVTVRNIETNKEETAVTDSEGRARVVNLQPGTYAVTVNASGFGAYTQDKVVVEIGRVTSLDVPLTVGGQTANVEVTSDAPVINTSQQDFASNINQTSVNELPINGRRAANFAILTPASAPDGNFGLISYRGISGLLNNNTVDGGDNNQALFSEERGRTRIPYSVSQASVREFQVNTSNYSAEYGRAAGAVVNTITKSGTNQFHGEGFEYYRNNRFGARNPRATQSIFTPGQPIQIVGIKPKDVRHQFGGNLGGPIVKDKAFFFFNYEGQRRDFPGLGVFSSASYLSGLASGTTARSILTTALGAQVPGQANTVKGRGLTDAQVDGALSFINSLTGEVPRRGDQNTYLGKFDWNLNKNNTFTATYNHLHWDSPAGIQTQATNTLGRASFGDDFVRVDSLNLRLISTISPTLLNEARFQYGRDNEFETSQPPLPGEPTTAPGGRAPDVFLTNGIEFGKPTFLERRAFPDERRQQYADTMTLTAGRHTIKFGGDINRVKDIVDNLRFEGGSYSYNNISDFVIDYVNFITPLAASTPCSTSTRLRGRCYTSQYQQAFGPTLFITKTTDYNLFVQDDFRITPRLTVNLGMRYEYEKLPSPQIPNTDTSIIPNTTLTIAQATSHFPSDKNNWGPRFGFAYDIFGNGKTSVRGGYGIYYGRINNGQVSNAISNTGNPAGQQSASVAQTSAIAPIFPNVLTSAPAGTANVQFFGQHYAAPQIHQVDLVLERQIARNTVVSVSYLASLGRKLPTFIDRNLTPPNATRLLNIPTTDPVTGQSNGPFAGQTFTVPLFNGARPLTTYGAITEINSGIKSDYSALVLQANRRLTRGLQVQSSYTLSKATDTGQVSQTFTATNSPYNVFDPTGDAGTSSFDVRHKFVASVVWNPTFFSESSNNKVGRALFNGFTIAPIVQVYSGRPFTAFVSSSPSGTQGGGFNGSNGQARFPLTERNGFRQPGVKNFDLRVSRRIKLGETANLEFLANIFNVFNSTQAAAVGTTFYSNATGAQPSTTVINGQTFTNLFYQTSFNIINDAGGGSSFYRERQVEFAVRFQF